MPVAPNDMYETYEVRTVDENVNHVEEQFYLAAQDLSGMLRQLIPLFQSGQLTFPPEAMELFR